MSDSAQMFLQMMGLFAVSALVGYLCHILGNKKSVNPPLLSRLTLRLPQGMARATLQTTGPYGWEVGPVLQRQGSPLPEIGDSVVVQVPCGNEVRYFRSQVTGINDAWMTINPPERIFNKNRRENPRRTDVSDWPIQIEGETACLVDLSSQGARIAGVGEIAKSQRVALSIGSHQLIGWVLAVEPDRTARIAFENPLKTDLLRSKTAPLI